MRLFNSDRKLLILSSLLLVIMVSFVVADFVSNTSSFSFIGEPGDVESKSFNLENTYDNYTIEGLVWNFIPDTNIQGNSVVTSSFDWGTFPLRLDALESNDTPIIFTMPEGFDAVDEDLESVGWDVGYLVVNGTATNDTGVLEEFPVGVLSNVRVQIDNHFGFYNNKVEFEIDGEDPRNISTGVTKIVQDGDVVTLRITYENSFENEALKFNKNDIEATLIIDGDVIVRERGQDIVGGGELGELELEFDVDGFDVGDKYPVEIRLEGFTTAAGRHGEIFEFDIEVEEETIVPDVIADSDGDGVNDDLDLCPETSILCDVDEAGCEMDPDRDGICNGVDRTPDGEQVLDEKTTQNVISQQTDDGKNEPEKKVVEKKESPSSGSSGSFFFGLIVGFIGAALFFTLTKV